MSANRASQRRRVAPEVPGKDWRRPIGAGVLLALVLALAGGWQWRQLQTNPAINYLSEREGAEWIRLPAAYSLNISRQMETEVTFDVPVTVARAVPVATLRLRAFRSCEVRWNDAVLLSESPAGDPAQSSFNWKDERTIKLPGPIVAGSYRLTIRVSNWGAHACLWACSPELGLSTRAGWNCTHDGQGFRRAVSVNDFVQPEFTRAYPPTDLAFARVLPWLVGVFIATFAGCLWSSGRAVTPAFRLSPRVVCGLSMVVWCVLCVNNMLRVPAGFGFDHQEHLDYVRFISEQHRLPLATDGWQMFQSPLYYLLLAPAYSGLSAVCEPSAVIKALRVLPMLCGLVQLAILYRLARLVFPNRDDLQIITQIVGGWIPMQVAMAQVIGNEPLAACLTAALTWQCAVLLVEPERPRNVWFFAGMGAVWGLALLAKVTPFVLAPLLLVMLLAHARASRASLAQGGLRIGALVAACGLVSGWYFLRNWIVIGKPFAGGWDPASGNVWWQNPSYRTWWQFTRFGEALRQPVYPDVWSLWDSLYSSIWLDGYLGGRIVGSAELPWNANWMIAGAWLGLVPMGLMFLGIGSLGGQRLASARWVLAFALAAILLYLAAVVSLYLRLPVFSTAKGSYLLGVVPCFALLAAAGAERLMGNRYLRALLFAALLSWAAGSLVAYFSLGVSKA